MSLYLGVRESMQGFSGHPKWSKHTFQLQHFVGQYVIVTQQQSLIHFCCFWWWCLWDVQLERSRGWLEPFRPKQANIKPYIIPENNPSLCALQFMTNALMKWPHISSSKSISDSDSKVRNNSTLSKYFTNICSSVSLHLTCVEGQRDVDANACKVHVAVVGRN